MSSLLEIDSDLPEVHLGGTDDWVIDRDGHCLWQSDLMGAIGLGINRSRNHGGAFSRCEKRHPTANVL
jgi:hypothetical protein